MSFYQFDASALVKRYATEVGSGWTQRICDPQAGNFISIASITQVEVASALARKVREGIVTVAERDRQRAIFLGDCAGQYLLTCLNDTIVKSAVDLTQRYPLRAYDAIQLATALVVDSSLVAQGLPSLTFVSADNNLIGVAQAEGLTVDNPHWHP